MAKQIYQVRYYGDSHAKNQPAGLTGMKLKSGSVFSNYLPILQLGIQTIQRKRLYLSIADVIIKIPHRRDHSLGLYVFCTVLKIL